MEQNLHFETCDQILIGTKFHFETCDQILIVENQLVEQNLHFEAGDLFGEGGVTVS